MLLIPKVKEIADRRANAGLSRHQLALEAGLGGSSLSRIESKKTTQVHLLRAKEIARVLNCEVNEIFDKKIN